MAYIFCFPWCNVFIFHWHIYMNVVYHSVLQKNDRKPWPSQGHRLRNWPPSTIKQQWARFVVFWQLLLAHLSRSLKWATCIVTALRPSVVRPSSVNIFKHLLLRSRWANSYQTSQLWSLGDAFSDLIKWRCHVIQDGRRGKVGQILKKSSSREPPDRFRRNLVEWSTTKALSDLIIWWPWGQEWARPGESEIGQILQISFLSKVVVWYTKIMRLEETTALVLLFSLFRLTGFESEPP